MLSSSSHDTGWIGSTRFPLSNRYCCSCDGMAFAGHRTAFWCRAGELTRRLFHACVAKQLSGTSGKAPKRRGIYPLSLLRVCFDFSTPLSVTGPR